MVIKNIRKVVSVAARLVQRTASTAQSELKALQREGVLSKKDVVQLVKIAKSETLAGTRRVAGFLKSELKHDAALARKLAGVVMERTRKASKTLSKKTKGKTKRKR